ncbi:Ankyrin repeats (3 copies) [Pirellulimonas nuda]|uniref:Ankyrin repeats (3 copies) n=1 Tax=Pirellulimonas nuda TaxID=2528009 RepID=A0A518DEC0_9BACT|nr:ankyrin repeat domain-containing protein [Pirellulimonas nuda]QDU89817.1 Ankyrin repeats (3 copies) [Pirellulimonas nuda]
MSRARLVLRWVAVFCLAWPASGLFAASGASDVARVANQPEAGSPLADAAEAGDWPLVRRLLDQGADVRQAQPDGMIALHWAALHGRTELLQPLVDAGADVNATTQYQVTPLSIACTHPSSDAVAVLLAAGAKADFTAPGGETPLMIAARAGAADSIKRLLAHGVAIDAADKSGQTALMWAAAEGNVEAVDALIEAGADLKAASDGGFTAMMFAARDGRPGVVRRLIAAGVDVNAAIAEKPAGERAPRKGASALIFAVESGHYELAMELVAAGADPNDQRNGFAPLHILSWVRKPDSGDSPSGDPPPRGSGSLTDLQFVHALVAAGADVNARLENGNGGRAQLTPRGATPLLYASRTADLPLMKTLVELGGDPSIPNADGCTTMMAAAGVGVRSVDEEAGTEPEVLETVAYLAGLGLGVNTVDKNNETAMHGAAYRCFPLVVAQLAELGADPQVWDHKNKWGWTPMKIAEGYRPGSFKPSPETVRAVEAAKLRKVTSASRQRDPAR